MIQSYRIPSLARFLRDAPESEYGVKDEKIALERRFNDLYAVFLHQLSEFAITPDAPTEVKHRLRACFEELMKVRDLLEK